MNSKWFTTAVLAAAFASGSAFASIPRQAVMGTQPAMTGGTVTGSLWYDDDYNVFFNPAYVNDYKNYVTVQKGMEGGWFSSMGDSMTYGVYVNRGGAATSYAGYGNTNFIAPGLFPTATYIGTGGTVLNTQRPIDFFIGGDMGMKWGFHVAWSYNRDQTIAVAGGTPDNSSAERTNRYWHFDFGLEAMGLEPFIGATVLSQYEDTTQRSPGAVFAKQDLNEFNVGLKYKYEGWTPYAMFRKKRESGFGPNTGITQIQDRMNIWALGVGHDTKVADGVHVTKHIGFYRAGVQQDSGAAEINRDFTQTVIPVNVNMEADATSWLTLRAGVSYDLVHEIKFARSVAATAANSATNVNDRMQSQVATPQVRIGSTLKFGKLAVDSAFGSGVGSAAADLTNTNIGFDSQTFAQVGVNYRW